MKKAVFKRVSGKSEYIQCRHRNKRFLCTSTQWVRWAKSYMNRDFRRKQKRGDENA